MVAFAGNRAAALGAWVAVVDGREGRLVGVRIVGDGAEGVGWESCVRTIGVTHVPVAEVLRVTVYGGSVGAVILTASDAAAACLTRDLGGAGGCVGLPA